MIGFVAGKKIRLSDKKKVETAASAEAIEKVKHSTSGTLVRDLLDPLHFSAFCSTNKRN